MKHFYRTVTSLLSVVALGCGASSSVAELGQEGTGAFDQQLANPSEQLIFARGNTACAKSPDSDFLYCWGDNTHGVSGVQHLPPLFVDGPQKPVGGLPGPVGHVSIGRNHACAVSLHDDRQPYCWGKDAAEGPFGKLTTALPQRVDTFRVRELSGSDVISPTLVAAKVAQMASGEDFTCMVSEDSRLHCTGENNDIRAGASSVGPGVRAVVAGDRHACALMVGGNIKCWGANDRGQLGNGTTQDSAEPVGVMLLRPAQKLFAGPHRTCALSNRMQVGGAGLQEIHCWGDNSGGRLVPTANAPMVTQPRRIEGLPPRGLLHMAIGARHQCVATDSFGVMCWGDNSQGQLGTQNTAASTTPVAAAYTYYFTGSQSIRQVVAGDEFTCLLLPNQQVACFGRNDLGQVGGFTFNEPILQMKVLPLPEKPIALKVTSFELGDTGGCAGLENGEVRCFGNNDKRQLGFASPAPGSAVTPTLGAEETHAATVAKPGASHQCVATSSGAMRCWGNNSRNQLGSHRPVDVVNLHPEDVLGLPRVTQVANGGEFSCAIADSGKVYCLGANELGQLGRGTTSSSSGDVAEVQGFDQGQYDYRAISIAAGDATACAVVVQTPRLPPGVVIEVIPQHKLFCWGRTVPGGVSTARAIQATDNIGSPRSVSAHNERFCVLNEAKEVYCYGNNVGGTLVGPGHPSTVSSLTRVSFAQEQVAEVSVGSDTVCARTISGKVYCQGNNDVGQASKTSPISVTTPEGTPTDVFAKVAAGNRSACVLDGAGNLYCFGEHSKGRIGTGKSSGHTFTPQNVRFYANPFRP